MNRILAILNRNETASGVLRVAQQIASRVDPSKITVLLPRPSEDPSFMPTEEIMTDERERAFNQESGRKAASLRRAFDTWRASDPSVKDARWLEIIGNAGKCVGGEASQADLIVIGHVLSDDPDDVRNAFHTALFVTDVPVIVAPERPPATAGAHLVIAWEKSEAVQEAVRAALPLLSKAEEVTIISANERRSRDVDVPPGLLEYLKDANVRHNLRAFDLRGRAIGEALLSETRACGGDLLVMGAYTHNAFVERVIGGATAELLAAAEVALFMHH